MVSTRGPRYKFSEGERVLCYEPDPTKAKVLYDSKVLEVIENKDKRGRRNVEYLIHFQGWNSSWDRCVSEDFVLKDTDDNRQLQRDLAEKAQLQLGAYLYRRERKKGGNGAPGGIKRQRVVGFSDEGSSSSTQNEEGDTVESDSSSTSQSQSPPPSSSGRANITLPTRLRDRLTFDYHLVMKRGKLSRLPASPCAAEILEFFVKWFARAGAWHTARNRHDPPQKPDLQDVSCRKGEPYDLRDKTQKEFTEEQKSMLNLVREIADGLRVYFDFVLRGHLLYKQEHAQYHELCGKFLEQFGDIDLKSIFGMDYSMAAVEKEIKSPKLPEYSHLPPDPSVEKNGGTGVTGLNPRPSSASQGPPPPPPPPPPPEEPSKPDAAATPDEHTTTKFKDAKTPQRPGAVARRLRSHKSLVSELEEPAASTSAGEPRPFETLSSSVGSSGSSVSEPWARPAQADANSPPTRTPLSLLLDKVSKWEIIPREGTEHLPCRIYGAIHLARLFVKLPEFLSATSMPDYKLKLILKHIDMFVQFLDEHSEWFGESYYTADPTAARVH